MDIRKATIAYGIMLVILGIMGYFATGQASVTALIPAFLGIVVLVLGKLAENESRKKNVMHGVVALALIAFFGTIRGFDGLFTIISGGEVARPAAAIAQSIMSVLSLGFVLMCVKSFKDARRNKSA